MTETDWKRLQGYSEKQNSYKDRRTGETVVKSNALYNINGQIDTGFLIAKCIKHAFKTYPKINIGKGSVMESDIIDTPQGGFDPCSGIDTTQPEPQEKQEEQHFAPQPDMSAGVTIDPASQGDNDDTF